MEGSKPGDGGILIFLPDELTEKVYSWQSKFREYVRMPKPHLTLMYPPFLNRTEWAERRGCVAAEIKKISPFIIDFRITGYFKDPFFLYMAPEKSPELVKMNALLADAFRSNLSGLNLEDFIPHVSVGTFPSEGSTISAMKQLDSFMRNEDLSFTVKEISYTVLDTDLRWKVHDIVSLGEGA